jgi:hypothetical protein
MGEYSQDAAEIEFRGEVNVVKEKNNFCKDEDAKPIGIIQNKKLEPCFHDPPFPKLPKI